jgi:hypothetical protein
MLVAKLLLLKASPAVVVSSYMACGKKEISQTATKKIILSACIDRAYDAFSFYGKFF